MVALSIQNVVKRFGTVDVLRDINIAIEAGDFLVLVGPSGCGKSTLLNMIAGLLDLSEGEIYLGGTRIDKREPKDRNIAMVFQSYALYPAMSVEKNMAFPLRMAGMSTEEQTAKVADVAELLQIKHLLKRKPAALSGGQRQRVAMGRALVRNPQLFLFDEPLSNLDAKLRVEMRTEIKQLHKRLGTTIVYVTHDQVEAMTMATQIAVMEGGVVQQFGTPEDIYDSPANRFVATFMGSPAMNLVPATVKGDALEIGSMRLPVPKGVENLSDGMTVDLGLRPEWFGTDPGPDTQPVTANVGLIEPTGPDVYASLDLEGTTVMARLPARSNVQADSQATFHIDMLKAVVFDHETGVSLMSGTRK